MLGKANPTDPNRPFMSLDTIDVRSDERFDEPRLAGYLNGKLPGADQPLVVRQFGGGAANLTYLLSFGNHEYVLRRPPLGPLAPSAHDMRREFKVLSVLHRAYLLAPQAFLHCPDPGVIGAEFIVMERRHGLVVRRRLPAAYAHIPDAPRQMSLALVDALVNLHAVDYDALGLSDLGKPAGFVERQIEGWHQRWQAAKTEQAQAPEMEAVYAWLKANVPAPAKFALVHNDFKLDNAMLASDDPGRIVAIFDWDMATLGDPLSDLGALLAYWSEPSDPADLQRLAMMPAGPLGFPTRAELVARYAERSGRSVEHVNFYQALGLFRVVVIIAQIYIRYARGQTRDQRFAAFGAAIPPMARAAQALID
jgi:aminoglycoside phosphotransferase (APT) family kinase protein